MRRLLAFIAALVVSCLPSCTAPDRSVTHELLDLGYDSIELVGPAPECLPSKGTRWNARAAGGRWDTGVVCCSMSGCAVRRSAT